MTISSIVCYSSSITTKGAAGKPTRLCPRRQPHPQPDRKDIMELLTSEQSAALRKPFPTETIGKMPRIWCGDCRNSRGACPNHRKVKCAQCRQTITDAHMHLDYVGHAETTDRLLQVDPHWHWEPVAFDADGLPKFDGGGGLWIRLVIGGVSRLGYGHAGDKRGGDAIKEAIGDAIRNAAMRFGVALDLWGATFKGDEGPEGGEDEEITDAMRHAALSRTVVLAQKISEMVNNATTREQLTDAWQAMAKAAKNRQISQFQTDQITQEWKAKAAELTAETTEQPPSDPARETLTRRLYALLSEIGLNGPTKKSERLHYFSVTVDRKITTTNELTIDEIKSVIFDAEDKIKTRGEL